MPVYELENKLGETLNFSSGEIFLENNNTFGVPPISYRTETGFSKDGAYVTGYRLEPKTLNFQLVQTNISTEEDYWNRRDELVYFTNPELAPYTFRIIQDELDEVSLPIDVVLNGTTNEWEYVNENNTYSRTRIIKNLYPAPGFTFSNTEKSNYNIRETVSFVSYSPAWEEGFERVKLVYQEQTDPDYQLIYPMEFPIRFNEETYGRTIQIENNGNYKTYPKIFIDRGGNSINKSELFYIQFKNLETGGLVRIYNPEVCVLNTDINNIYLKRAEVDYKKPSFGFYDVDAPTYDKYTEKESIFERLDNTSNLVDFFLQPGTNTIEITGRPLNLYGGQFPRSDISYLSGIYFFYTQKYIGV